MLETRLIRSSCSQHSSSSLYLVTTVSHTHTFIHHTLTHHTQCAYTTGAYTVAKRVAAVLWREYVESDSGGDGQGEEEELQLYK